MFETDPGSVSAPDPSKKCNIKSYKHNKCHKRLSVSFCVTSMFETDLGPELFQNVNICLLM